MRRILIFLFIICLSFAPAGYAFYLLNLNDGEKIQACYFYDRFDGILQKEMAAVQLFQVVHFILLAVLIITYLVWKIRNKDIGKKRVFCAGILLMLQEMMQYIYLILKRKAYYGGLETVGSFDFKYQDNICLLKMLLTILLLLSLNGEWVEKIKQFSNALCIVYFVFLCSSLFNGYAVAVEKRVYSEPKADEMIFYTIWGEAGKTAAGCILAISFIILLVSATGKKYGSQMGEVIRQIYFQIIVTVSYLWTMYYCILSESSLLGGKMFYPDTVTVLTLVTGAFILIIERERKCAKFITKEDGTEKKR